MLGKVVSVKQVECFTTLGFTTLLTFATYLIKSLDKYCSDELRVIRLVVIILASSFLP